MLLLPLVSSSGDNCEDGDGKGRWPPTSTGGAPTAANAGFPPVVAATLLPKDNPEAAVPVEPGRLSRPQDFGDNNMIHEEE